MIRRCCRVTRIEAATSSGKASVRLEERLAAYTPDGVEDPIPHALLGRGELSVTLACSTACVASALGEPGDALRSETGSVAVIRYERKGGRELLRVEGIEAELVAEDGKLRLTRVRDIDVKALEACLLGGAKLVAPQLQKLSAEGVELGYYTLLDYAGHMMAFLANPLARLLTRNISVDERGCLEELVARSILETLMPLATAALLLHDFLVRVRIVYPLVRIDSLPIETLSRAHREVSLLASKLLERNVDIKVENAVDYPVVRVYVDNMPIHSLAYAPRVALAVSIASALVWGASLLAAIEPPIDALNRTLLLRELERRNTVFVYATRV